MAAGRLARLFLGLECIWKSTLNREGKIKMHVSVISTLLLACGWSDRLCHACLARNPERRWRAM
jgi:hypothetical protein